MQFAARHGYGEHEYRIKNLFLHAQIDTRELGAIIISSVVPPLLPALERMAREYFDIDPLVVEPTMDVGISVLYDDPKEVGADRIVNAVAAFRKFGGPPIVVDFGTATTFDAISQRGEYLGGAIVPGIAIAMQALFEQTAKLPRIELTKPQVVIGKNTVESMQAGMIFGYAALVASETKMIEKVDPYLTLDGLKIIFDRLQQRQQALE